MHNGSHGSVCSRSNASASTTRESATHETDDRFAAPRITTNAPLLCATSLEIAQRIHDEFLICKICLDVLDNPKSLACLHTFCKKCIENHISAEVTYKKNADYHHFTCPLCRKPTNLPIGGVRKLPDNFLISGLADMLSRSKHSSRIPEPNDAALCDGEISKKGSFCDRPGNNHQQLLGEVDISGYKECEICGQIGHLMGRGRSSTPSASQSTLGAAVVNQRAASAMSVIPKATWKCLDCGKMLCDQCVKQHREIKVTKDHATYSLATESAITCAVHPDESVRFYCEACSVCVCVLCTFNDHREHEMKSFGEAIQKLREELRTGVNESQAFIQNTRQRLSAINKAAETIHEIGRDVRQYAVKAVDEIRRQENSLIEQLHSRVGQSTMQMIKKAAEWNRQLLPLEAVQSEIVELLEGQDLNILINNGRDVKEKLNELMANDWVPATCPMTPFASQLYCHLICPDTQEGEERSATGEFLPASCRMAFFAPQPLCLGHLTFPDTPEEGKEEHFIPEVPTSRRILAATQTDAQLQLFDKPLAPITKEVASGTNATSVIKQMRHRAINTASVPSIDQETNTRPRGVNVSITFGGNDQVDLVDNYLLAIKEIEVSDHDSAFAAMDNLTRARIRRKLNERWSTVDTPETSNSNKHQSRDTLTNPTKLPHRRFSDNRALRP